MRNTDHQFPLGLHYNFGTDNPWGSQYQEQTVFPPVSGNMDYAGGEDMILAGGEQMIYG